MSQATLNRLADAGFSGWTTVTGRTLAAYQAAVVRIGVALTFGGFLLREWPHRRVLYGDLSPWSGDLARQMLASNHAFTVLAWSDGRWWFEGVYAAAIAVSVLMLLGWRTRATSLLFMVLVLSLQNRAVLVGDGGDNVIHLMAIYLAFTRCGQVWSLDARAARRGTRRTGDPVGVVVWAALGLALAYCQLSGFASLGMLDFGLYSWGTFFWLCWLLAGLRGLLARRAPEGEGLALLDALATLVHNAAMLVIAAEVCFIYATAGWYKIQGSLWQGGTALWYPLHLHYFEPWPGLADGLSGSSTLVTAITYGTVIAQVGFPFLVFNRRIKNVMLTLMIAEHLGIAIVLGLPFFSLAMITADAVFLPTGFLARLGQGVARGVARIAATPVVRQTIMRAPRTPERDPEAVSVIR
ncbi:HTTM domain-containing protein [Streptacidiphilus jiangxiensis]|uniref:HTTM-like domain-containing protein n=1 Tax=Streptacidiphilus jiangxiensis TaxID=235985 RepID=A0A1H7JHF0_STRJI|nr:HTTM domain-containing protein [Streptacidiphilus jiangxiensis]SEK73814.1 hypothetical protein SAMN05414137_103287 [Streptacidiphilus jiangxiensis]